MKIKELIQLLLQKDQESIVVVNGVLVQGIEGPIKGRTQNSYGVQFFHSNERGLANAIFFTRWKELSDGKMHQIRF